MDQKFKTIIKHSKSQQKDSYFDSAVQLLDSQSWLVLTLHTGISASNSFHSTFIASLTDYGHRMRVFFQVFQIFWPFEQIGQISFEVFQGTLGSTMCSNFVPVYPYSMFLHYLLFSFQKAKIFIHFTGFSIWDWDWDLGCREYQIQSSCVRSPWHP